jgi:hypothetical protein
VEAGAAQGAAGTQYFDLTLHNHGSGACVLTGFPGVSLLDAAGHQIGLPAERETGIPYGTVTIAPSATAYVQVGVGNPGVFNCPAVAAHEVRVFPPNETVDVLVPSPAGLVVCAQNRVTEFVWPVLGHPNG